MSDESDNDAQLQADEMIFGVSFTDITGKRINPRDVEIPADEDELPAAEEIE